MDLKQKCEEVMKSKEWTNEDLATYLGVSPSNLSSAKAGRRALPYQAIIKLEQLRGTKAEKIIDELLRIAACVALAVVVIFSTVGTNPAYASMTYEAGNAGNTNYGCFDEYHPSY